MDRVGELLGSVTPDQLGVEIGPWFNPIAPKSKGYHSLALDVYDVERLTEIARQDPGIPDEMVQNIEDVDLLGQAMDLAQLIQERGLSAQIDYVISAHNFEHLPDPIRFIQACEQVLRPGGALSMAIPDRRTCFDYFRPCSTTGDLLDAFWEGRDRPTPGQLFTHHALHAYNSIDGVDRSGWSITSDPSPIRAVGSLETAFSRALLERTAPSAYPDVHCWTFTPASLEWIITDLQAVGLVKMKINKIVGPNGHEFYARLVNEAPELPSIGSPEFARQRTELLHRVNDEAGMNSRVSPARDRKSGAVPGLGNAGAILPQLSGRSH
jgi:SAM-dependent methyltransferase